MIEHKQLLRLLDEAHAVLTPVQIAEMSISMDITEINLNAALDEATAEWEAIKDAHVNPTLQVVREAMQKDAAQKQLEALIHKYDNYGAGDSEGWQAMRRVEYAADDGKCFPLTGRNPFQLYESRSGWRTASAELVAAAEVYWKALLQEKLGVTIA